jgi:hypothetical protein
LFKRLIVVAAAALFAAASPIAFAKGGGSGNPGGSSAGHMSDQGLANTNGPDSSDRDKGMDRAEDRMSQQGMAHEKETGKHKHRKSTPLPPKN